MKKAISIAWAGPAIRASSHQSLQVITTVTAAGSGIEFEEVSSTDEETTIRLTVPENATVELAGARVVPEFGAFAALALAASIASLIALIRTGKI